MSRSLTREIFVGWIRTGRVPAGRIEYKFNGWHDPDDGKFTQVGAGRYYPPGSSSADRQRQAMARPPRSRTQGLGGGGSFGGGGATGDGWESSEERRAPEMQQREIGRAQTTNNRAAAYVVRSGDTLIAISKRTGVTTAQLQAVNPIEDADRIEAGQKLTVPIGIPGKPGWVSVQHKGLTYSLDSAGRTQDIAGQLDQSASGRSKRLQADAGKPDRRPSDDGGHFIAPRFGGPKEAFNHFAQDANFNRGSYRVMEDIWAKAGREGKDVRVHIGVSYPGAGRRPDKLKVEWIIDGKRDARHFRNSKGGKSE